MRKLQCARAQLDAHAQQFIKDSMRAHFSYMFSISTSTYHNFYCLVELFEQWDRFVASMIVDLTFVVGLIVELTFVAGLIVDLAGEEVGLFVRTSEGELRGEVGSCESLDPRRACCCANGPSVATWCWRRLSAQECLHPRQYDAQTADKSNKAEHHDQHFHIREASE